MSRKSRASIKSQFIHVMVQGINKETIFKENLNKKKYLNLLFSYTKNFNVNIISNCVMENHFHCIFHFENIEEISKLMHNTNTAYAKWYNDENSRVGYVFRDRYKIEEIKDLRQLYTCIRYIHNNPVKAGIVSNPLEYEFSSYSDYFYHKGIYNKKLLEILQLKEIDIDKIIINYKEDDIDNCYNKKFQEYIKVKGLNSIESINNLDYKKELILFLKDSCNLNYTEISGILNVSTKTINRILKS